MYTVGFISVLVTALIAVGCDALGDSAECTDFDDEGEVSAVQLRLVNARQEPLFVGPERFDICGDQPPFSIEQDGIEIQIPTNDFCKSTCEGQRRSGDCAMECLMAPSFRIDPGGALELNWSGLELVRRMLPSKCTHGQGALECSQAQVAEPGVYKASARALGDIVGCEGPFAFCDCQADASGVCELVDPGELYGVEHSATATVHLPEDRSVELVFE